MIVRNFVRASTCVAVLVVGGGALGFATSAGAQTVDPDFCTNLFPELCTGSDGQIDEATYFPPTSTELLPGYFIESPDPRYQQAVDALARQLAGDDSDGNKIPDSPEIAVCGAPGCLPEWATTATATESPAKSVQCCDGIYEAAINKVTVDLSGMSPDKRVAVFTMSTPVIAYFGSYPAGGTVDVKVDPPELTVGLHKIVAVGTADGLNEASVKIWDLNVTPATNSTTSSTTTTAATSVAGQTAANTAAANTTAVTGSNAGIWVTVGSALVLLGSALVIGARRRNKSS